MLDISTLKLDAEDDVNKHRYINQTTHNSCLLINIDCLRSCFSESSFLFKAFDCVFNYWDSCRNTALPGQFLSCHLK